MQINAFKQYGGNGYLVTFILWLFFLIVGGGFITLLSYLGMYAFANPDADAWYGETLSVDGNLTPGLFDDPTNINTRIVDVH